ncbi:hypothetical protein KEM56_006892 [Ascosphaera pollenicola]|nr:hypothetical protein KEM56_006892 [Ascosphaera pollenicola]
MDSSSKPASSLLYCCIAHETTILAEHTAPNSYTSTASSLASVILPKVSHSAPQKLTYTHNNLFVHYIADCPSAPQPDGEPDSHSALTFLVVATAELGRRIPFAFLVDAKRRFLQLYEPGRVDFAGQPAYGCAAFNPDLRALLQKYNTQPPADSLASAKKEIDSVRDIMTMNIDRVLERGERLDSLIDKTDRLGSNAREFRYRSSGLRRQMWWKNVKVMAMLGGVGIVLIWLFVGMGCGLPFWGACVGH